MVSGSIGAGGAEKQINNFNDFNWISRGQNNAQMIKRTDKDHTVSQYYTF